MGERFKQMREALHLSQADVARVLGITPGTVSKIERGITFPRPAAITLLCKTYGISEEWLKTGNGPMPAAVEPRSEEHPLDMQTVCNAMMKIFNTLTEEQQDIVLKYVENLVDTLSKPDDPN